jgi:hypothetical protein
MLNARALMGPPNPGGLDRRFAMQILSLSLLILWYVAILYDVRIGGTVHLLAVSAALIVFMSGNRKPRHV